MKVMLIEDDRTMRAILKTLLELERFTVSAWSGHPEDDIISLIRNELPDVLLLDVHLRSTSGLDILRQIRSDKELGRMRVLMTSGMDLKDQCLESGADAFLLKPYMPDELISMIRTQVIN
jgi:DNA-binding response OmpR family regulator